ncbi:helix-turn-helix transcriptional regulator [Streptomyces synnematoformans]|uniref:Helix-turn-helix transcriptional regulator n=1 Tax=Streptomyces synnematoformans TaxID=415721 RepID=A0ABP5K6I7_9ACTN
MSRSPNLTMRLRRLGRELRKLREDSGLTIEDAGHAIERSDSTISRIENGSRKPQLIELKGLLDAYGTPAEVREALLNLLRQGPEQGWWEAFEDTLPSTLTTYIGLEADAATLRVYALALVHSLLRTEEYSRAVLRAGRPTAPVDELENLVTFHARRQEVLRREPQPLALLVVLDEACLRRAIGGPEVMRAQVEHLIHCARNVPNITLQMLPFSKGAHASLNGSFTILDFPDPTEPGAVYMDTPGGNLYMQKPHDTRRFDATFGDLRGIALDESESVRLLERALEEM